ncbi:hypothetical protein [Micromonospora sp. 4G55]|uniref:hypothetical protein n=1 Tax=Micromonospora sp. 4G55 TaxID=2806102 RepID=UPI001A45D0BB|nr:hypothetical protein [Micromonospora sp. 4G55]MBM0257372.1 hypothetical protein [Micromonospora sp. 4G55]
MSTPLDDLRFWMQTIEDARRTVMCPPGMGEQVRAMADRYGVGGMYDVHDSAECPEGHILVIDHHALEASTRQAVQRMRIGGRA